MLLLLQISPLFAYSRIDCNFDSSACSYTEGSAHSWMRTNNATVRPGHDHTSGHGYWLSTNSISNNHSGTQEFSVISPYVYSTRGPVCLRFWYVLFFGAEQLAPFEVKINHQQSAFNGQIMWSSLTKQTVNNWTQAWVEIPPQSSYFYVSWQAILTSEYYDIVGIDDITLSPGACPHALHK